MKDEIKTKEPMIITIRQKDKESFLLRADKIEYLHIKKRDKIFGDIFDHHLMFYLKKDLVFKVWLPNEDEDKEFKNINEALESVGMDVKK